MQTGREGAANPKGNIMTANPDAGAVEVSDVDSAAAALEARYATHDEPTSETSEEETETEVETEEVETEVEDETEDETESDEQEPDADEEAPRFETLEELAEATGMELDEFLKSIKGKVKIDGEESEITLAEMREGQQRESDYRRKTMQLAEERKTLEEQQTEAQNQITQSLQQAGTVLAQAQAQLTHEFNAINWTELQAKDPTQYMLKRQAFGERQAQINQAIEQGTQQAQALKDQQTQQATEAEQNYIQEQDSLLMEKLPTWSDEAVRAKESAKVTEYLSDLGFQPEEIGNIKDHRLILMARDAMQGQKTATDIDVAKKKVKKVPKLVKPNARQNVNQTQKKVSELKKRVKQSGSVDDAAQLLLARRS